MGKSALPLLGLIIASLAGCATDDPDYGAVAQHNIVVQTVDLDPKYAGVPIEGGSGRLAAEAVKRYNAGAVKALQIGSGANISATAPPAPVATPNP